ncbi:hypothetical protein F2Q68_00040278 [Brassica cretica]|uniref:Uncharacterized protein n=1 Tax=Brassica cretica TaxID=69181 RepID=A0A8S9MI53_BRACR|nr:hypothetical protein F2Q68_00040278 [Brassica cretica]
MGATKMVFHHMVLIFHSFKGFSDLEDFKTSRKSSDGAFSHSPFHNRSERFGFSDLSSIYMFFRSGSDFGRPMEILLGSLLKYNALEDFQEVL